MVRCSPPTPAEFARALSGWEGQFVEFKESVSDSLARELVAFANAGGGRIYVGVSDDKQVKGVSLASRPLPRTVRGKWGGKSRRSAQPDLAPAAQDLRGGAHLKVPERHLKISCKSGPFGVYPIERRCS